jgi:hypothetical protein
MYYTLKINLIYVFKVSCFFLVFLTDNSNTVILALQRPTMLWNSPLVSISVISDEMRILW